MKSEVASRVNEIAKLPLEFDEKKNADGTHLMGRGVQRARAVDARIIDMIHPAITTEDWSLMDCQEYFVDLEKSLTGDATALEVSGPGQLRDDQMGIYRELEQEVGVARGLPNKLRAKHPGNLQLAGDPRGCCQPVRR